MGNHVEPSQFNCIVNQLTGFYVIIDHTSHQSFFAKITNEKKHPIIGQIFAKGNAAFQQTRFCLMLEAVA